MGVDVKTLLSAGKSAAKVTGQVAYENRDILAQGAKMGVDAKVKKNQDVDAKTRYRDFLQWKESGMDIEEFAFSRSELTGRPWQEIVENIRFHNNRVQSGTPATSIGKSPNVAVGQTQRANTPSVQRSNGMQVQKSLPDHSQQSKALPGPNARQDIRYYLQFSDVQEALGLEVTGSMDIPENDLLAFAELCGTVEGDADGWMSGYGRQVKRELLSIARDAEQTVRDFSPALQPWFNDVVSWLLIPTYQEAEKVVEWLCAQDTKGEYKVVRDDVHRALMIAYNSLN